MENRNVSKFTVPVKCTRTNAEFTVKMIQNINTDPEYIFENAKSLVKQYTNISNCEVVNNYIQSKQVSQIELEQEPEVTINGEPISSDVVKQVYTI